MEFILLNTQGEHSLSTVLGSSLTILLSFVVLLALLVKFAYKPIMKILDQRQAQITESLDDAQNKNDEASSHLAQSKQSVVDAQQQAREIVEKARIASEKIKADAYEEAKREVADLRRRSQELLDQERADMLEDLKQQMTGTTVALTQKLLKRELTNEDHQRLINEFIEGLD